MQPKDMAQKKFKMIPGADYSDGPISKYGTFGNMMRVKMNERNHQIAEQLDKPDAALDFINPMSGSMKFLKSLPGKQQLGAKLSTVFKRPDADRALHDYLIQNKQSPVLNEAIDQSETVDVPKLYRGIKNLDEETMRQFKMLKKDDIVSSNNVTSTSDTAHLAQRYIANSDPDKGRVLMEILDGKGVDVDSLNKVIPNQGGREYLMKPNTNMIVEDILDKDNTRILRLRQYDKPIEQRGTDKSRVLTYDNDAIDYTTQEGRTNAIDRISTSHGIRSANAQRIKDKGRDVAPYIKKSINDMANKIDELKAIND